MENCSENSGSVESKRDEFQSTKDETVIDDLEQHEKQQYPVQNQLQLQLSELKRSDTQGFQEKSRRKVAVWYILNILTTYFVVGLFVVGFWCSIWNLINHYVFPSHCFYKSLTCMSVSYPVLILLTIFRNAVSDFILGLPKVYAVILSRFHTYTVSLCTVAQWLGLWTLQECLLGTNRWYVEVITLLVASGLLLLLKCHSMTAACPVFVRMDLPLRYYFQQVTFFMNKPGTWSSVYDAIFSVGVIPSIVVCFWKGTWSLFNIYLFPNEVLRSAGWTLVISYALATFMFLTQSPAVRLSMRLEKVHWIASLAFEDIISILFTVVNVAYWRGYWMVLETYLPYQPTIFFLVNGVSFLMLALGLTAKSIAGGGSVARDGELTGGQGVVYDTFYLNHVTAAFKRWQSAHAYKDAYVAGLDNLPHRRVSVYVSRRLTFTASHDIPTPD